MGDFYEPNHYEILNLDETASSRDIVKACLSAPYSPADLQWAKDTQQVMQQRCDEAYRVLGDPVLRASYDREQGYTKQHLARRIGHSRAAWGMVCEKATAGRASAAAATRPPSGTLATP
jgi:DnaJ-class molecular chaperone